MTPRHFLADRRLHWALGGIAGLIILLLVVLAAFPWGVFKSTIEARLSARFGRPVTIARIERLDAASFTPTIAIRGVRVPQAEWAGTGDLATIRTATVRFHALPVLLGHFRPDAIDISGMNLVLVRGKDGRKNWTRGGASSGRRNPLRLRGLRITDSMIEYRDAVIDRHLIVGIRADSRTGVRLAGSGTIMGAPVKVMLEGPAIESAHGKPWPFRARIVGAELGLDASGTMDAPLDTGAMTFDVTAHATDLKLIDAVIEAGLIGTQPVRLKAHVCHTSPDWIVTKLSGTIGQSDIAGGATVKKRDGRTLLDGDVVSNRLDFDDLASDAGLAKARALSEQVGPHIVPNTRINIRKITKTDGTIRFTARQLVGGKRSSAFTALKGVITLDHQLLTVSPLRFGLKRGTMAGRVVIDQRGGKPEPTVTIDLAIRDSNIASLAGDGDDVNAPLEARALLAGRGSTIREVVGRSSGHIAMVARDGSLPAKIAALIGFDVARGLTTDGDTRAGLRCVAFRLDMRGGTGRIDPLIIDTTLSQSRGEGSIAFPDERLAITLTGAPKQKSVLRLPGSVDVTGVIREPEIKTAPGTKSVGNILKAIGQSIAGTQAPKATDADCDALSARALAR